MKTAFNISASDVSAINKLFIELSDESISYIASSSNDNHSLKIVKFDIESTVSEKAEALSKLIAADNVLRSKNIQTLVSLSFKQSILTPSQFHSQEESLSLLKELYGDSIEEQQYHDDISGIAIINDYSLPVAYDSVLRELFPDATVQHQYSLLIEKLDSSKALHVLFYFEKIIVIVFNDNKLQIVQSFVYKVPADVIYHLLNVCKQFDLQNASITAYGLIEKRSALYEDTHKYFSNFSFAELPANISPGEGFTDYPAHFFAHLFYTAS
ncbi:MAG: DUF3822 family protein [Ginsengibacter sp.]